MKLEDYRASYMRYVPGAGGGRGIIFRVETDSIPGLEVTSFEVNGTELPSELFYEDGKMRIQASRFYADPERAEGAGTPPANKAPLYFAESYHAIIRYRHEGQKDSLVVSNFEKEDSPLYP